MDIINKVENYVSGLYSDHTPETSYFHDINHTREVVEASKIIAKETGLNDDENEIVLVAAWFHDVGYNQSYDDHEEVSIKIAREFLTGEGYEDQKLERVLNCIADTKVPQDPRSNVGAVLCDADMFHLSQEDFMEKTLSLRKEQNSNRDNTLKKKEYYKTTLEFFNSHNYQTQYGIDVLTAGKLENEKKIKKKLKNKKTKLVSKKQGISDQPDKSKIKTPTRGVETMFRLTANNQISLSSIADNKANILITVNSIILSIIITMLFSKFNEHPYLIIPTLIFLLVSLTTIVFAILTTRPKISSGTFTKDDIREKRVNLLFFGNFYKMSLDDYEWAVKEIMKDFDGLYGTMIRDQYYLGIILAKKYIRLRAAYNIFMFGIILSVLVFIAAIVLYSGI